MVTRERRRHLGESASVVGPPRWMAGGACRGVGLGQNQTPHRWERGCHRPGAGQGLTVRDKGKYRLINPKLVKVLHQDQPSVLCNLHLVHSSVSYSIRIIHVHFKLMLLTY